MSRFEGRVAGSDTREALATATVRKAARGAALTSGPGLLAAFGFVGALANVVDYSNAWAPWITTGLLLAFVAAGIVAWRSAPDPAGSLSRPGQPKRLPSGVGTAAVMAFGALLIVTTRDEVITALLLPFAPVASGWIAGSAARTAVAACVPDIRSAAAGVVTAWSLGGLAIAGHLSLVTKGSGPPRAAGWALAYTILGIGSLIGARRALPEDRRRIAMRVAPAPATGADADPSALSIESITVAFGSAVVLDGASLHSSGGELIALVGGNGAGKSTLLKAAAGFVPVQTGRVLVAGDDVTTLHPEERTEAGLAFVSGARPVFPDLTVIENLRVAAFRTHPTTRAFNEATELVLGIVPALASRRRAPAGVLSGGEQRLLAVAQTLFRRPAVLLADELSLGLDLEARLAVMDLLRLLADQGVCVVVVDHDLPSLLPRADRAALLANGTIEIYDKPAELLSQRSDLLPATFLAGATR